jgi:hypothetical protein
MSNLLEYIKDIKRDIIKSLKDTSIAYYTTGMDLFHKIRTNDYGEYQPAVGNLCIAIELLLKAIVAQKAFRYLYSNIPVEVQLMLTNPESLDSSFKPRKFSNELKSFQNYNTIELAQAISFFYNFFPSKKQEYKPYLTLISSIRNISVHAALPRFQRYDLERVAYISTIIFDFAVNEKVFSYFYSLISEKNNTFLKNYDCNRIERVQKAIDLARNKSKEIEHLGTMILSSNEWEYMVISCPVCGSDAFINGYTDEYANGEDEPGLMFYADSFQCEDCGLELIDSQELRLAGINLCHDRSEEIDRFYPPDEYER